MTILEFTPPIRRNYLEEATIKVLKGEKIKNKKENKIQKKS